MGKRADVVYSQGAHTITVSVCMFKNIKKLMAISMSLNYKLICDLYVKAQNKRKPTTVVVYILSFLRLKMANLSDLEGFNVLQS